MKLVASTEQPAQIGDIYIAASYKIITNTATTEGFLESFFNNSQPIEMFNTKSFGGTLTVARSLMRALTFVSRSECTRMSRHRFNFRHLEWRNAAQEYGYLLTISSTY
jgi:hypothetical protein